jgi:hypothetical protein
MYFVIVVGPMDGASACFAGRCHSNIVIHGDVDGVIVSSIDNPDAGNVKTSSMAIPANILRRSISKRLPFILSNVHGDKDIAKLDQCRTLSFVHRDIDDDDTFRFIYVSFVHVALPSSYSHSEDDLVKHNRHLICRYRSPSAR